jgi:uncharacterized phage protein (TIGR01671 family)
MSREIKFRAWDKCRETMPSNAKWVEFRIINGTLSAVNYDYEGNEQQLPIMQFTGLKDKNGVDIYEGDILENTNPIWKTEIISFAMSWGESNGCWDGFSPKEDFEIIGNIHANPELLEAK